MIPREFLLASSLKAFLIYDGDASCELTDNKPLMKFVEEEELIEFDVYISLMKWEIHHGLKIDPESYIHYSIIEIVEKALDQPELTKDEYMDHFLHRLDEISGALEIYDTAAEEFDREYYLSNKN